MKKTENVHCKFIDSWKKDRPWLHHNVEQNVIWSATGASKPMDQKSYIPISPNGKRKIHDPFKDKIDSSRTIAMIQSGP